VAFSATYLSDLPISTVLTEQLGNLVKQIPFDIPTMLHPPLVHFAIALPVIIVILEIFNLIAKMTSDDTAPRGKTMSGLSFFLIILLVVVSIGAYATGAADGKNAWELLDQAGQTELKEHKLIGGYVVVASLLLLIFKIISFTGTKTRVLFLILAIGFTALTLKQGKDGGELVYIHGANVQKAKELDDKLFDVQEELDTLKSEKNATVQSSTTLELKIKEVETQKQGLANEVTALKAKLDETNKSFETKLAETTQTLESKANEAIKVAEEKAKVAVELAKAEAAKAIEAAKTAITPTPQPTPAAAGQLE